jgi:pilus assembly protein CpaF
LVNIRKFSGGASSLAPQLIDRDMLDVTTARFLRACVRSGVSVIVAGAARFGQHDAADLSGAELEPSLRVVVAEEVFESDILEGNGARHQPPPASPEAPSNGLLPRVFTLATALTPAAKLPPDVRPMYGNP